MKRITLKYVFSIFAILLSLSTKGAPPTYVTIPDANFRAALKALYPGCFNASDQMDITCSSVTGATSLDVSGKSISNLTGISYFAGLTSLDCHNNQLSSLPPLPLLTFLNCSSNFLTTSPPLPPSLTHLDCANNLLSNLPSPLPNGLTYLDFHSNQFIGLPVPPFPGSLTYLNCSDNRLTYLFPLPSTLANFSCQSNQLDFADLEGINPKPATYQASPQINNSLLDKTAAFGSTLSLDGTIGGSSNQYQWYKNGVIIPGATSAVFNKANLDFTDAGTYQCQVNSSLSGNSGIIISSRVATITVIKGNQNIVFGALPAKTFGNSPFTLSASASSGLPISYVSSDATVATVSGNMVTIVGAGYCTIWATQAGNAGYNPAINVGQGLTIYHANQTITFPGWPAKSYGDPSFLLTATASSGLPVSYRSTDLYGNPEATVATVSGNTVTIIGAGSTWIQASQEGNSNYWGAGDVSLRLDVSKASQTITFAALPSKTYGDPSYTITATASSGLPITYVSSNPSVASIVGSTVTIVGAGSANITASQAGSANYNAISSPPQTLIVAKANQTITFAPLSPKIYGDASYTISATASSGLPVTYVSSNTSVATIIGNTITITGAGSTTITASQAGDANYVQAFTDQPLTVAKANQVITFAVLPAKSFGDAAFTLAATASSGLAVDYASSNTSVVTIIGNTATITGAGSTTITASQGGDTNYNAATQVTQTLTVSQLNQTVTFAALPTKNYGDAPFALTASASSGLAVSYTSSNTSVATISGNILTIVGAGASTITASQTGNVNYNTATPIAQAITVNKAGQTITFPDLTSKTFGDTPFTLAATSSSGLPITYSSSNTSVATISGNTVTIVGGGSTQITATQMGDINYYATSVTQVLTVFRASQTITFALLPAKTFGDAPFTLTAISSSGLPVFYSSSNTSVATISGSTVSIVGGGSTSITATQSGNANYTSANSTTQTLTVNKASQTITFAALPVKTFGNPNFTLTGNSTSGLPISYTSSNPAVATISGNTVTIMGAGSSTITATQSGNGSYSAATSIPQMLTVNKANQTITFSIIGPVNFGIPPMALNGSSNSGLPISYQSSNLTVATISGFQANIVSAGSSTITATQVGNANYNAALPVSQLLTANKANQTLIFTPLPPKRLGELPFTLTSTTSSGLPASYSSSNTSVATISGNTVTIVSQGFTQITASQIGNSNYNAAAPTIQNLNISGSIYDFTLSPNPANQNFSIQLQITATASISVQIKEINNPVNTYNYNFFPGESLKFIDSSGFANGLFQIKVGSGAAASTLNMSIFH